uniref:Uncharacterized protein n=1 Tax=Candidatus Kentrum sp. LPFa TaxID=2126335 RepID=A0A450WRI8_9GAMM|nr:MAG: hypothetical protein BECKLPF1236B_GA0070989_118010 [Candidatus Kentron sp. LPFa]
MCGWGPAKRAPSHPYSRFLDRFVEDFPDNGLKTWPGAEALARADYQARVLSLAVSGSYADRYFSVLYDSVLKILKRMPKLQVEKLLYLDETARIDGGWGLPRESMAGGEGREAHANFDDLLAADAKGRDEYDCRFCAYDLGKVLGRMPRGEGTKLGAAIEATRPIEFEPVTAVDPEPVPKETTAFSWLNTMLVSSGLGGLAAFITWITPLPGWFSTFTGLEWGITLAIIGNVVTLSVLFVIGFRHRDKRRRWFPLPPPQE